MAEYVITGYTFNASDKTITITESVFMDITLPNILTIMNLSTGDLIYDSSRGNNRRGHRITSFVNGVITFDYSNPAMTSEDVLQIFVNTETNVDVTNIAIDGGTP